MSVTTIITIMVVVIIIVISLFVAHFALCTWLFCLLSDNHRWPAQI